MGKIEERLNRIEKSLACFGANGERHVADMTPTECKARILELFSKELDLDHAMTWPEYEDWLIRTYPAAASASVMPSLCGEDEPAEMRLEALRAKEAWFTVQVRKVQAGREKRANVVMNEEGA